MGAAASPLVAWNHGLGEESVEPPDRGADPKADLCPHARVAKAAAS